MITIVRLMSGDGFGLKLIGNLRIGWETRRGALLDWIK